MNIREVEQLTGLKKANIRYYEQEGLLSPQRNVQNNYREYSAGDVEILDKIKLLRTLGVSFMISENYRRERLPCRRSWRNALKNLRTN